MDLMELVASIRINLDEFDRGLNSASTKFKSFSDNLSKVGSNMKDLLSPVVDGFKAVEGVGQKAVDVAVKGLQGFGAISAAVGGFGAAAVKAGMEFDATMSEVSAISGKVSEEDLAKVIEQAKEMGLSFENTGDATSTAMSILRSKALEMGATTKFSASEAAEALTYMAMAGWKAGDMISGIEGIMNLAAASGEDLALTSDIVTDALTAFGMKAGESGHFADILAKASSNANTNISMMGETFKYVAPVAGALGYSAEDTALAIGLMANSGIKASQAGTSLRGMLTRLAKPTKQSIVAMEELGISLDDGEGNMKSFKEIMDDLRSGFGNLMIPQEEFNKRLADLNGKLESGEIKQKAYDAEIERLIGLAYGAEGAEKAKYAAMLAGQEAMSGMLAIVSAAPEDYEKLSTAIYNCNGAAEEMAAIMADNLAGDVTLLKSAFESLQIAISDSVTPTLREFATFGREAMAQLLEGFQSNGLDGLFTELSKVVTDGVTMLAAEAPKFAEASMGFTAAMGEGFLDSAPKVLDASREIVDMLSSGLSEFIESHRSEIVQVGTDIIEFISEGFSVLDSIIPLLSDFVVAIADGIATYSQDLFNTGMTVITTIIEGITEHIGEVQEIFGEFISTILESISSNAPTLIEGGILIVTTLLEEIGNQIPQVIETAAEIITTFIQGIADNIDGILDAAGEIIGGFIEGVTNNLPMISEAVVSLIQSFAEYIRENIGTIIETGLELLTEFSGSLRENVGLIVDAAIELALALAKGFADGLPELIEHVPEIVSNIANIINDNAPKILETGIQIIATLVMGLIKAIPTIIENIPKIISAIVDVITAFNWIDLGGKIIKGLIDGIKSLLGDVTTTAKTIVENIKTVVQDLPGYLKTIGEDLINGLVNGIKAGFTWVKDHVVQLVELVVGTIKDLFGIHSPSTVFAEIGENLIAGLLQGIQDTWNGIVEFFTGAAEALIELLGPAWEGFKEFFSGLWESLKESVSLFGEWLSEKMGEIVEWVKEKWNGIAEFFSEVWQGIMDVFQGVAEFFSEVFGAAAEAVQLGWQAVVEFFQGVWEGVVTVFSVAAEVLGGFFTAAAEAVQAVWTAVGEFFQGVWEGIQAVFEPVAEVLGGFFQAALEAVQGIWEAAAEFFSGVWESIQEVFADVADVLGGFFEAAWDVVQGVWEAAVDFFSGVADGIYEVFEAVTAFLGETFQAAWDAVQTAWDAAIDFFGDIWSNIKEAGSEAANAVRDALKEAWNAIKEAWDGATEFFKGIYEDIVGVFKDIWKDFKDIGKDIVDGIKDGVLGAWESFTTFMSNKISGIINSVKEKLGIHSPSKVFAGIGENMALGLAEGWDDEYSGIKRQIERGMDFGTVNVGLNATRPSYGADTGYSAGNAQQPAYGGNTYVTINSPKAVDAITAAREWKKTTQRMAIGYV